MVRATADNPCLLPSLVVLDSDGVLAHIFKPDELKSARTITVHAFSLVLADNDVAECGTRFEEEDGIGVT